MNVRLRQATYYGSLMRPLLPRHREAGSEPDFAHESPMPIRQDREAAVNLDAYYHEQHRNDLRRQQRRACHHFKHRAQARRDSSSGAASVMSAVRSGDGAM